MLVGTSDRHADRRRRRLVRDGTVTDPALAKTSYGRFLDTIVMDGGIVTVSTGARERLDAAGRRTAQ